MKTASTERILAGLADAKRIEEARKFFDAQLDKNDTILTPQEYYRHLADIVAAIPPFTRPKFHVHIKDQDHGRA